MVLNLAVGALMALTLIQDTDTTFNVDPHIRLDVSNYAGEIIVRTWSRNAVRIRADHSRRDAIAIDATGSVIRVRAESWRRLADRFDIDITEDEHIGVRMDVPRVPSIVDYIVTVPASISLVVGGPFTDVTVDGTRGEVSVKVNEGDVIVRGGTGRVSVRAIEGDVRIYGTQGDVRAIVLDGDVLVQESSGEIQVETTDGQIILDNVQATSVQAYSVDGDIEYYGDVHAKGLYLFSTHDGDVTLRVPSSTSARVSVAMFDGEFTSDFRITLPRRTRARRLNFTIGTGDAEIEIEAFDGDIRLLASRSRGRR